MDGAASLRKLFVWLPGGRACARWQVKTYELRPKAPAMLRRQLEELRKELAELRVAQATGGAASKLAKISSVRKSIARLSTVFNQKRKDELKKLYKGKKRKPIDLRAKKTRAIRRKLSRAHQAKATVRQFKKTSNSPRPRYALVA
eukprot:GHVT01045395.1.p1 GENE.GHVT01045395.1~~GHVT01045395.1.p1  ORF type:complete len:145 (-),score=30.00 GHVT01045395.1:743-1177(-)